MPIRKPIFVVPLDLGNIVSGNVKDGYSVSHLSRHKAIGLVWKTDGASNVWARGWFSAEQTIDFCALVAANALPGTKIRLRLGDTQADVDGGSAPYDSGALDFISPSITREDGLYHSHLELDSPVGATWWRIDITGHTGDFQASNLVLGLKQETDRFYNYDFAMGVEDLGSIDWGRWGVVDEQEGTIFRTLEMSLGWETEATYQSEIRPMLEKLGKRGVVYLCFDPEPGIYRQAKTYMGWFQKIPIVKGIRKPGTFTLDYSILSMI